MFKHNKAYWDTPKMIRNIEIMVLVLPYLLSVLKIIPYGKHPFYFNN